MDVDRAARLQALLQHPSWPELVQAIEEHRDAYLKYLSKHLMATGELPADFEFKRGFLTGMKFVSRYPGIADKTLERMVAKSKEDNN